MKVLFDYDVTVGNSPLYLFY